MSGISDCICGNSPKYSTGLGLSGIFCRLECTRCNIGVLVTDLSVGVVDVWNEKIEELTILQDAVDAMD